MTPTTAQAARAVRETQIVNAAREIAEAEGWPAVTVRRLAEAIGFSQPVLYGHFPDGRDGIVRAVALDGFARFTDQLRGPARSRPAEVSQRARVQAVMRRYLRFMQENPAVYEAMFSMPTGIEFAAEKTPEILREAFAIIFSAAPDSEPDPETWAELFWSAMHGVAELAWRGRLRPAQTAARSRRLVELFSPET